MSAKFASPNIVDTLKNKDMAIINTTSGKKSREDEAQIRTAVMQNHIPIITTLQGFDAVPRAIKSLKERGITATALQDYHV